LPIVVDARAEVLVAIRAPHAGSQAHREVTSGASLSSPVKPLRRGGQ